MKLKLFGLAALMRIFLLTYGIFHDRHMELKYTDIDYSVFTEASQHVFEGRSPYSKDTYKYTPLLAFTLLPNIFLSIHFGKVLFCLFDLLVGYLQLKLLDSQNCDMGLFLVTIFWLFNPFTMTISSRGNAEAVQIFIVMATLLFLTSKKLILAGICFGISVHFKLYPVIYALPFVLYIGKHSQRSKQVSKYSNILNILVNKETILFTFVSGGTFLLAGYAMYYLYGFEFIQHTYLFHFTRSDTQHNFSPYFYLLLKYKESLLANIFKLCAVIPQLVGVVWFGAKYFEALPYACFMQTFVFVTFNKVCTSQYFIWYIGLLPLAYSYMKISLKRFLLLVGVWLFGQGIWLFFAYLYEFRNYEVLFYVWMSSLMFLFINCFLINEFTKGFHQNRKNIKKTC